MTVFKNALVYGELTDIAVEDGIIKKIGKIEKNYKKPLDKRQKLCYNE